MKITFVSWNIWHGKYLDDVIRELKRMDAGVIGLQEVITRGDKNDAFTIAEALGYEVFFGKALTAERKQPPFDMGNAVLSRFPIRRTACHFLSDPAEYKKNAETEPRVAAEAVIEIKGKEYRTFSIHLAYSDALQPTDMRTRQVHRLLPLVGGERTVLMGDLNSLDRSDVLRDIEAVIPNADRGPLAPTWTVYPFMNHPRFPATELKYRLDYIFASRDLRVSAARVEASKASDHLPVSATIEIPD